MAPKNHRDEPRPDAPAGFDPELWRAYADTDFHVDAVPPFVLRIGEPSAELAALHDAVGVSTSAFVTACNPGSVALSDAENARRHAELRAEVRRLGFASHEGRGRHPSGDWPAEASLLVLGIDEAAARSLGRRFGQKAIVWTGADATPRLIALFDS